jgi:hypothetical protein
LTLKRVDIVEHDVVIQENLLHVVWIEHGAYADITDE